MEVPQYVTLEQTAERLQCSTDTVRREIRRGNLKASRFGRRILIAESDLAKALKPIKTYRSTEAGGRVA